MYIDLSQFYQQGPYLHQADNPIPFYAAYFSASGRNNTALLAELDALIRSMQAKEQYFLTQMGVKSTKEFEAIYLTGSFLKVDTKIEQTLTQKISQQIGFFLAQDLPNYFTVHGIFDKAVDELLKQFWGTPILRIIKNILLNRFPGSIDKNATATQIINAFNRTAMSTSRRTTFKGQIGQAWESTGSNLSSPLVLLRDKRLLSDLIKSEELNPIVKEHLFKLHIINNIQRQVNEPAIKSYIISTITNIFNEADKEKRYDTIFIQKIIDIISIQVDYWLSPQNLVKFLSSDAKPIGALGEYGAAFVFSFNMGNPINANGVDKLAKRIKTMMIGQTTGTITEKIFNPVTKKIEYVKTQAGNLKKRTAPLASDVSFAVSGPNGKDFYALQIKNSLQDILDVGEIKIRDGIQISKLLADMIDADALDISDAQKFAYVLVNNMFQVGRSAVGVQMFFDRFIGMVANFYLQTAYLNKILYAGSKLNQKIGNSFIIFKHTHLIPMSRIFIQLRAYLDQEGSSNTPLHANYMTSASTFEGKININASEMTRRKRLAATLSPQWRKGDPYGGGMLAVGIRYGTEMYNGVKMPSMQMNVKQLVSITSSFL